MAAWAAAQVELAACRRQNCGLSAREWELLPLLEQLELSYAQIGERLSPKVAGTTVKPHVEHIGQKLGIAGGRAAVIRAARERGLLPEGHRIEQRGGE